MNYVSKRTLTPIRNDWGFLFLIKFFERLKIKRGVFSLGVCKTFVSKYSEWSDEVVQFHHAPQKYSRVAQLVEHRSDTATVEDSNSSMTTNGKSDSGGSASLQN